MKTNSRRELRNQTGADGLRWVWAIGVTFLTLGGYVASSPLFGMPIHLYAAVVLAIGAGLGILKRFWQPGTGWVVGLWATFGLTLVVVQPGSPYGGDKVLELFTATLLSAIAPLWLLRSRRRQQALLISLFIFSATVTVLAIFNPDNTWRLSLVGTGYIGSGRIIALLFVLALAAAVLGVGPRWASVSVCFFAGYFSFETGSRGPFIAAILAALVVALFRKGAPGNRLLKIIGAFLIAGGVLAVVAQASFFQESRFGFLADGVSTTSRLELYRDAILTGAAHPLGVGWGNFGLYSAPSDIGGPVYPHNVLLEVWAEAGWLSCIVLVLFIATSLRNMRLASNDPTAAMVWAVAIFFVVNALVSGDINDNRAMFSMLALGWVLHRGDGPAKSRTSPAVSGRRLGRGRLKL